MRRSAAFAAFLVAVLATTAGSAAAASRVAPRREVRLLLGTTVEVLAGGGASDDAVLDSAFDAMAAVEAACSRWVPDGELVQLNDAGGGTASAALRAALARALDVARESDGAFDPTVGSSPRWDECGGVGPPRGYHCVRTGSDGQVTLQGGARLDLDALAKGQAADAAVEALRRAGVDRAVVDLGGSSVRTFGAAVDVAVADPEDPDAAPWGVLTLTDEALGTSGQAQRPGHLRDPRTGSAAESALGAVVVARSAAEADALSTALFVLGREGLDLVRRRGAEGLVLWREDGRPVVAATPRLADGHRLRLAPGVELR